MSTTNDRQPVARAGQPTAKTPSQGQILVIFAGALLVLMLMAAVVVDVSWYWVNSLRVQRAADAAALAGAVELPKYPDAGSGHAYDLAYKEAAKNGYTNGVGGVVVTPLQDATYPNRLNVRIDAPIGTFFMRVVGIKSIAVSRTSKAEYVQPVPMGSPDPFFGVGYLVKPVTTSNTSSTNGTTSQQVPDDTAPAGGTWSFVNGRNKTITTVVEGNDNDYAFTSTIGNQQQWINFGLATNGGGSPIPNPAGNQTVTIRGIEVDLSDAFLSATCSFGGSAKLQVELSWNNGVTWSTPQTTANLTNATNSDYVLGLTTSNTGWGTGNAGWGPHTWVRGDLTDANFRVRITYLNTSCGTRTVDLDQLGARVGYTTNTTTTTTTLQQNAPVTGPNGQAINSPQKFWAAMQSQGAPNIQGDAYMTKYERRKGTANGKDTGQDPDARYDPNAFYNYAVEVPAGAANATIWVYDPGFCDATSDGGLGEYWSNGTSNNGENYGPDNPQPISSFFDVYNTNGTSNTADDTFLSGTGNTYRHMDYQDQAVYDATNTNGSEPDCTGLAWHYNWVPIASGLSAGTYRIHSYSTDPNSATDQDDATALNAFAFYATATGGTPRIYGIGAMEAYVRLPGGQKSEFYLAQIDAVNAGKTMYIDLWDPGDTGKLSANLQILAPVSGGFSPTQFTYQGSAGTTNRDRSSCDNLSGTSTSVTTNTGNNSLYNGCWLRIQVDIPSTYTAPVDPVSGEKGWWKIRYNMGGSTSEYSTDLTTWQVTLHNNPVHLVVP